MKKATEKVFDIGWFGEEDCPYEQCNETEEKENEQVGKETENKGGNMVNDLISRQDVINKLLECGDFYTRVGNNEAKGGVSQCIGIIHDMRSENGGRAMIVVEKKPVPMYELTCTECASKIQYMKAEVITGYIKCPVCGVSNPASCNFPVNYVLGKGVVESELTLIPETKGGWVD